MKEQQLIDHLFRHQYGKMVAILTRIFGLQHLEMIEDAIQDTFATAITKWRAKIPDNPEAWLTKAVKNRIIDLLRKVESEKNRIEKLDYGPSSISIENLFEEDNITDSQLRMIFTACHPALNPKDQIAFALKAIGGFSLNEIAVSLLLKPETVKKRVTRAKKTILAKNIDFSFPKTSELNERLHQVYEVIYLLFNEGFHSNHPELLIRKDLCGEAVRLNKLLLTQDKLRTGTGYALFALLCYQSARLETKQTNDLEIINLKEQDRSRWYQPLIELGHQALLKTNTYSDISSFHFEACIAKEHIIAESYESTNWENILKHYIELEKIQPNVLISLSKAMVQIQLRAFDEANAILKALDANSFEQKKYLYYGVLSKYYEAIKDAESAIKFLEKAIEAATNSIEKNHLQKQLTVLLN